MGKGKILKKLASGIMAFAVTLTTLSALPQLEASAAPATPRMIVDMNNRQGEIMHGASGFLYGFSSDGVPTTDLTTPLKPIVLATKGALGTEHPYSDALDVAETFFKSGGQMIQMYCSNYYAIFGPRPDNTQYAKDLKEVIVPAVVEWKEQWKENHGTPEAPKDEFGKIDIDEAIVYLPINEGAPQVDPETGVADNHYTFYESWKLYYDAIKEADPNAAVGGPNDAAYGHWRPGSMREFMKFCAENDCWPDVQTWHQLDDGEGAFTRYPGEFAEYRSMCKEFGMPEQTIVINEYATMEACGVPGILIRYIANLEENNAYGCLPFWHQANNLNDLAADANEPNSAWWFYKWYADMSGDRLAVTEENTTKTGLTGVSTIDDNKAVSSTIFGGVDGEATIVLKDLDQTPSFMGATKAHVKLQAAYFKGFLGAAEPETVIEGTFELKDGNLVIDVQNMQAATGYNLVVTPAAEEDLVEPPLVSRYHEAYEAEDAQLVGGAVMNGSGGYYASGRAFVRNFSKTAGINYTINVPADGKYRLEFVYGNGIGTNRGDEDAHKPVNKIYQLAIDGASEDMLLENTMLKDWTDIYVKYVDLTAGEHTITIRGDSDALEGEVLQDVLYVTYVGAQGQPVPSFNTVFEAEEADFNTLADTAETAVSVHSELSGYSGGGYVTGLSVNKVANGGGLRWAVNVPESGLYNVSLNYQSKTETTANIYVGNTARTFDGTKTELSLPVSGQWNEASVAVYLQKGMNIVDVDTAAEISLDYMRIQGSARSADYAETTQAADTVPESADTEDVPYYVWKVKADDKGDPELYQENRTVNKTAVTTTPAGTEYVVGRSVSGDASAAEDADKYLEFTYTADEAGVYAMQIFHSNDEIFGTHGYNTKIIDKYACVQVNDQEPKRYFFINSLSKDTFKEKTVYLNLEAGENTIKVFNDDSWSVLKGLDDNQADAAGLRRGDSLSDNREPLSYYMDKPGNIPITNSLPNISKFIITPSSLSQPLDTGDDAHKVTIRTSEGGFAVADKNAVGDNGEVTFTITSEHDVQRAAVNGQDVELTNNGDGSWTYKAANLQNDIELQVIFAPQAEENENQDALIANNSFGTGNTQGWAIATNGSAQVETRYFNQYDSEHYLKLSGAEDYVAQLSQTVTVPESGVYSLDFVMKNLGLDASVIGEYNSLELTVAVDGKIQAYQMITPSSGYQAISSLMNAARDNAEVQFTLKIDAKAGFEAYVDDFTLTKSDIERESLAYFVDCGDHDPSTLPDGEVFGLYNTVTDQLFKEDPATGKQWGVIDYLNPEGVNHGGESKGAFTRNTSPNCNDGQSDVPSKTTNYRYAAGQDGNAQILEQIGEMYVDYKFQLEPNQTYDVEVCVGNNWSNSSPVNIYANYMSEKQLAAAGLAEQSSAFSVLGEKVEIEPKNYQTVSGTVQADQDGFVTINVRRPLPASNATINVNYIYIRQAQDLQEYLDLLNSLLENVDSLDTEGLPERAKAIVDKAIGFATEVAGSELTENDSVVVNNAIEALKYAIHTVNSIPDESLLYFVDCGDHGTSTVSKGDRFGLFNTKTDQIYGADPGTGKIWGVDDPNGSSNGPGLTNDEGVYTRYTWAHERDQEDQVALDNLDKNITFRYACGQDGAGIDPRYVTYRFQVDSQDGTYPVEVGLGNIWGNSANPTVYANLDTDAEVLLGENLNIPNKGNVTVTGEVQAKDGYISIDVRSSDATINLNYIKIGVSASQPEAALTGIEVTAPTKTEYEIGEKLDTSGLVVTARYSDGSATVLTETQYTLTGFSSEEAGEKTVTVSYTEDGVTKTAAFVVTVKELPAVVLEGIEITAPTKTEYKVGDPLDTSGISVTAKYSDGSSRLLEEDQYIISGFSSEKAGEKMVTVSYTEGGVTKTAAFTVTVKESTGSSEDPGTSEDPGSSEGPGTGSSGSESGGTESGTGSGTENNNNAQTGDGMTVPIILLSLLVAASAGIAVVLGKKRRLG